MNLKLYQSLFSCLLIRLEFYVQIDFITRNLFNTGCFWLNHNTEGLYFNEQKSMSDLPDQWSVTTSINRKQSR